MAKRGPLPAGHTLRGAGGRTPAPPKHLAKAARDFWRKYAPEVAKDGRLTTVDLGPFERLAVAWGTLVDLDAILTRDGLVIVSPTGATKQHPAAAVRAAAEKTFLALASAFGLTPAARLRTPAIPEPDAKTDDIESRYFG